MFKEKDEIFHKKTIRERGKEPMNVIETVLEAIAGLTVETTSCFVFFSKINCKIVSVEVIFIILASVFLLIGKLESSKRAF